MTPLSPLTISPQFGVGSVGGGVGGSITTGTNGGPGFLVSA